MSDRDLMQQALNALQGLADYRYTKPVETTMKALNERLAHCDRCGKRLGGEGDIHTCTPDPIGDAQDKLIAEMAAQPEQKPIGYLFQHEETGLTTIVDVQQVEWGFEKNNPRHQKIGPVYTTPPAAPVQEPVADAMARYLRVCSTGGMPEELQKSVQSLVYDAERLGYFKAATAPAPLAQRQTEQEPVCIGWDDKTDTPIMGYTTPPAAQQIDEAYAVGYSNGMTEGYEAGKAYAAARRKPLTDEQALDAIWQVRSRVMEAAHGIKENT